MHMLVEGHQRVSYIHMGAKALFAVTQPYMLHSHIDSPSTCAPTSGAFSPAANTECKCVTYTKCKWNSSIQLVMEFTCGEQIGQLLKILSDGLRGHPDPRCFLWAFDSSGA